MFIVFLSPLIGALLGSLFFLLLVRLFWRDSATGFVCFGALVRKVQLGAGQQLEQILLRDEGVLQKELENFVSREETMRAISPSVTAEVAQFVDVKLEQRWPMVSMFLNAEAKEKMKAGLTEELLKALPGALRKMGNSLLEELEAAHFISERISGISIQECKKMLRPYVRSLFMKLWLPVIIFSGLIGLVVGGLVWFFC